MAKRIYLQENGLAESGPAISGYREIGYNNSMFSEKSGFTSSTIISSGSDDVLVRVRLKGEQLTNLHNGVLLLPKREGYLSVFSLITGMQPLTGALVVKTLNTTVLNYTTNLGHNVITSISVHFDSGAQIPDFVGIIIDVVSNITDISGSYAVAVTSTSISPGGTDLNLDFGYVSSGPIAINSVDATGSSFSYNSYTAPISSAPISNPMVDMLAVNAATVLSLSYKSPYHWNVWPSISIWISDLTGWSSSNNQRLGWIESAIPTAVQGQTYEAEISCDDVYITLNANNGGLGSTLTLINPDAVLDIVCYVKYIPILGL